MRRVIYSFALILIVTAESRGTTIVVPSDRQLVDKSPVVVLGRVASSVPEQSGNAVRTRAQVEIHRVLKGGEIAHKIDVVTPGGILGDRRTIVPGSPQWRESETVLLFLHPRGGGDYLLVDLFLGKFSEIRNADGSSSWERDGSTGAHLLGEHTSVAALRESGGFVDWLSDVTSGRDRDADYFVAENTRTIREDFTLLADPEIYRWKSFDRGVTVSWRSYGSQGTYSDGGRQALRTGMSSWSGYAAANIRYRFDGAGTGQPGGLGRSNGINEVLFEDPLEEIAGAWDATKGGVVGVGGFNAVASGGEWKPPFNAGGAYGSTTVPVTWEILEGNLVIQNGVSSSRGIPESELAEILAHEFGHTLGLGHSADSSALMHYRITGVGPGLRADDQLAVRWLYPLSSGGGPVVPPQAPSGLAGRGEGPSSVRLDWTDRSTNETSFIVYMAVDAGPFSRVGEAPANQVSYIVASLTRGVRYRFVVTASNAGGESAPSNAVEVAIEPAQPQASFSVTPVNGVAGLTPFRFFDTSTGPVATREWRLGDGTLTTTSNPAHTYAAPGEYEVILTVRSGSGTSSVARRVVRVSSPLEPPRAAFSFSPATPSLIDELVLSDESTGMVQSWSWSFGDGTTAAEQNPRKRYGSPGTYAITLSVSGHGTVSSITRTVAVSGGSSGGQSIKADFLLQAGLVIAGREVRFSDRTTGEPNSWFWDFGDGFISTEREPSHTFRSPGTYTLLFRAGSEESSSSISRTIIVRAADSSEVLLVPAVANLTGAGGASWRSDLTIFNPAPHRVDATLSFLPLSGVRVMREIELGPYETRTWGNTARDLFGHAGNGGAVLIEAAAGARPRLSVASRTFTRSGTATFGQGVPAILPGGRLLRLIGIRDDEKFRTNVGLVNTAARPRKVTLRIFAADGGTVATLTRVLAPDSFLQEALRAWIDGKNVTPPFSILIEADGDGIAAYGSVVDNISQDPVFIAAVEESKGSATMLLPVAAATPGAAQTRWLTDLTRYHSLQSDGTLRLRYLPMGQGAEEEQLVTIPAGATGVISDVIGSLFRREGAGALLMEYDGALVSRTYTVDASGGSFGQGVPALPLESIATEIALTGLRHDASYRSNLGIANPGFEAVSARLEFRARSGEVISEATVSVPARSLVQWSVSALAPTLSYAGVFSVTGSADHAVAAYASVIDNTSGDPIFIRPR